MILFSIVGYCLLHTMACLFDVNKQDFDFLAIHRCGSSVFRRQTTSMRLCTVLKALKLLGGAVYAVCYGGC